MRRVAGVLAVATVAALGGASGVSPFTLPFGAGCTLKVTPPDDGGTGGDAAPQTVGDQCAAIFTELCMQAIGRCGEAGFTLDTCVTSNMAACCSGSVCNETSKSSASAVDACKSAIDAEDCYAISIDNTPAPCQGVPQKP